MPRRLRPWHAVILAGSVATTAHAQAQTPSDARSAAAVQAQLMQCFLAPAAANEPARIAFTLGQDGELLGEPSVVEAGEGPANEAFAEAAIRAVQRCAPYRAKYSGEIVVTFEPLAPR